MFWIIVEGVCPTSKKMLVVKDFKIAQPMRD